jgi:hypothetical protein
MLVMVTSVALYLTQFMRTTLLEIVKVCVAMVQAFAARGVEKTNPTSSENIPSAFDMVPAVLIVDD